MMIAFCTKFNAYRTLMLSIVIADRMPNSSVSNSRQPQIAAACTIKSHSVTVVVVGAGCVNDDCRRSVMVVDSGGSGDADAIVIVADRRLS